MDTIKKFRKQILLIILLALVIYLSFDSYFVFIGINSLINAIAVMGIVIISGYAKQLHLGQAAFQGLGAYTSAILMTKLGINFWVTIPLAMIVAGLFGWILSIPTLKLKGGSYLALVTQTFGEIIYVLLLNMEWLTNGSFGISGISAPTIGPIDFTDLQSYFFLCLFFVIVVYIALKRIVKVKFGRFFISIRESEEAAQSIGVNTRKYKMIAFVIATSVGGLAGVLYGPFIGYLSPEQFRWSPSLTLVSMAIVGGLYSLEGGIIGSVLLTFLPELLRSTDQLRMILYGVIVILTLAFLPDGLVSLFGKKPGEIRKMLADQWDMLSDKTIRRKKKKVKAARAAK
ncbi:MAG TPA: branched-chain amino acid ABC transporter permease [Firmicutes bacterium]|nr:branched-chain amino acid ABC transporter permease [Bacillota bacterium]